MLEDVHEELNIDLPGPDYYGEYFTVEELKYIGFSRVGTNTKISRKCSFYAVSGHIGDNVRIDDFCILKGYLEIGSFVHICAFCMISGVRAPVVLDDFVILAARCSVYTGSNDHSADALGAGVDGIPAEYTKEFNGPVRIGLATLVGAHCVILPDVRIGDGASIGANCVVSFDVHEGQQVRSAKPVVIKRQRNVQTIMKLARQAMK